MSNEGYVFVSYAHKDSAVVLPCIEAMKRNNIKIWYDEGIQAGFEWPEYIAERVISCKKFILFVSKAYLDSQNCKRELNFAISRKKDILSVFIEDVELSPGVEMQLGPYQSMFKKRFPSDTLFVNALCREKWFDECREGSAFQRVDTTPSTYSYTPVADTDSAKTVIYDQPRKKPQQGPEQVNQDPQVNTYQRPQNNVQRTPQNNVPRTPQNNVQRTPQNNVPSTPQNSVPRTPQNNVQRTPQNNVQRTPYVNYAPNPQSGAYPAQNAWQNNGSYNMASNTPPSKNRFIAGFLGIFLGSIGAQKFYLGQTAMGILYLLLCFTGIPWICSFVEAIKLFTMTDNEFKEKYKL